MTPTLLDAAFRLVSFSVPHHPETDEERLAELRNRFPNEDARTLAEACALAKRLEDTAVELSQRTRKEAVTLDLADLEARCPGFSPDSYWCAVNDGWILTRNGRRIRQA